ncbi:unnamed protein product [Gongylonema pulchrum]|uniref:non-specific serine/threonine protein kinase n=1 Tax=Gongylonema pulchrum TaxID=637853 RepID=A0A183DW71_9BILA|nr:unnamed protein product [Gongylonema pulchrum]
MSMRRRPKKTDISLPSNFEHRYHAGYDPITGQYHGLPKEMSMRRRPKKTDISLPSNFEHRYHAGYDPITGQYHGLPKQWQAIIGISPNRRGRPRPVVDPSCITPMEIAEIKTVVRGDVSASCRKYPRCGETVFGGIPMINTLRKDRASLECESSRTVRIPETWTPIPQV